MSKFKSGCEMKAHNLMLDIFLIFLIQNAVAVVSLINNRMHWSENEQIKEFQYCVKQTQHPSLKECAGRTAISFLQKFDEKDNYTLLSDVVSRKDERVASPRSLGNLFDVDPVDFRGILENAGAAFGQRSLEWHMDSLYPGLMLKIGPTADRNSVAEFILDPSLDNRALYGEPSTARVLTRQYLLPFLLGFKFNLIALVPLLFAGVTLLLKKSLFFAKLAIYISSFLGVGGVVGALSNFGGGHLFGPGFGLGGIIPQPLHHVRGGPLHAGVAGDHGDDGGIGPPVGHYPGKAPTYPYETNNQDQLYHQLPYKRTDRMVNFSKPREYPAHVTTLTTASPADRFYEYEKQILMQNRSAKKRSYDGKLGPSTHFADDDIDVDHGNDDQPNNNFKSSAQSGWKVVDMRA